MKENNIGFLSQDQKQGNKSNESAPFNITDAHDIVNRYITSTTNGENRIPVKFKVTDDRPIDGFYFKYEKGLKEMLMRDELKGIYLAVGQQSNGGYTIVLYGVTNDQAHADGREDRLELLLEDGQIYDLCDPCPDRCPIKLRIDQNS